ncbi:MAG: isoamylase early set domain-containing protein [Anaerolineales bacterium]|nr:isoamylase early set domain-containing protein [Anaerolineales bacterium]
MIKKTYAKDKQTCRVTFKIPTARGAEKAHLCGDFTDWEITCIPMKRRKDGSFSATVMLQTGQSFRYRYLVDDTYWENDEVADAYTPNPFGSDDCVVSV